MSGVAQRDGAPAPPRPPRWRKDPPPRTAAAPAVEALAAALDGGAARAPALDAFWADAERRGTPLVDAVPGAPDERIVTFLWRDRHGVADGTRAVVLLANKLTDPTVPAESSLERVPGTDVWWRAFRLSARWRGTYTLAADDGTAEPDDAALGPATRWRGMVTRAAADARNPRRFPGARGGTELSVVELPDAPAQPFSSPAPDVPRGRVDEVAVPGRGPGEERRAWVHVPAAHDADAAHRLLVLLDGDEWHGRRDAPTILDALHHDGRIAPTITLMVDGGDVATRWADMTAGASYLDLLTAALPAWVRDRYPVGDRREDLVLAGESLGGLAALRAAIRSPERVGAVVAQSSSLWWDGQEAADAPSPVVEELRARPPVGVRAWTAVGRDEWVLLRSHRALRDAMAAAGMEHELAEHEGGHDALCWRGGLADGLLWTLGRGTDPGAHPA